MKQDDRSIFERATQALRSDVPDSETITASASRVARGLGIEMNREAFAGAIQNCDDVQQLLNAYRAGTLPEWRALVVRAHLRECGLDPRRQPVPHRRHLPGKIRRDLRDLL